MHNPIKETYIKVTKNGPYLVYGTPPIVEQTIIVDANGVSIEYGDGQVFEIKGTPIALCRCGHSKNAPFCDGAHAREGFDGTESAGFAPIEQGAERIHGPHLTLIDNSRFCAFARFCDAHGRIWNLVKVGTAQSDKMSVDEANLCPAGRLIIKDKEGKTLEHPLPQSIGVLEDSGLGISGPLWIKGGIRVESADGKSYEIRNRQTLCRCGESSNKPFCDGTHAAEDFRFKAEKAALP